VELPGEGVIRGEWDLRRGVQRYLGGADWQGVQVLAVGAASGFLSFSLEDLGAEVISFDLAGTHDWDLVPRAGRDLEAERRHWREHGQRITNAYWYCHERLGSPARLVHSTAYEIPEAPGQMDVASVGCLLMHLRDPLRALERVAQRARERIVVVEVLPWHSYHRRRFERWSTRG